METGTDDKACGNGKKRCNCPCHKMPGILVALIGLVVLLGNTGVISAQVAGIIWPVALILIGLKKSFGKGMCKCCARG